MTAAPRLLWRGEEEVAAIKPAGLSCERPEAPAAESLLVWLRRELAVEDCWLPHRLDRLARGIVLAAVTREAAAFHSEQIRARRWEKTYLARIVPERGRRSDELLGPHAVYLRTVGRIAKVVRSGGQPARLEVLAVAPAPERNGHEHVLIRLHTGRYHQIRAMLEHLGAPLAGDPLYGGMRGGGQEPPYLEHAVLRLPLREGRRRTLFLAEDPDRERLHPSLEKQLQAVADDADDRATDSIGTC
ncbi:MAG: RNA pseudouridine synthase [Phycisphaerales bacterium]|nr:RNA pseudouridine synthase [Phycisphaerales bacterium]